MGFSQEDESEKPEAAWENPVLVIVRGIKYNESYKMLTGGICMGSYLNPGCKGFEESLNSAIYVDKTGLIEKVNAVVNSSSIHKSIFTLKAEHSSLKLFFNKTTTNQFFQHIVAGICRSDTGGYHLFF